MNLAQSIDKLWTFFTGLVQSAPVCFGGGYGVADCSVIWKAIILAIALVVTVVVLLVARRIIRAYLRHRAAIRQLRADQTVASQEVMNTVRWDGGKAATEPQTHGELAAQIGEAIRQNRD